MEIQIPLSDLIICLLDALDLVSPEIVNHHKRVSYIAFNIASTVGLPNNDQCNILIGGALHDAGALTLQERLAPLEFEFDYKHRTPHRHANTSYLLFKSFKPFSEVADIVRFHHLCWNCSNGDKLKKKEVPIGSHILHLADRIDILIDKKKEVLGQVDRISKIIEKESGKMFAPELVKAFKDLSSIERFWLDLVSPYLDSFLRNKMKPHNIVLDMQGLTEMVGLFSRIIDFRSRFTATHSSGVAASSETLARLLNFSEHECQLMYVAGLMHDLGKLAIPAEILEKPASLTPGENNIIKSHTFHGYRIMEKITALDTINEWGSLHHERLDGSGYPFHLKADDLSLGSRIMCVADIFTAITEDRPYRKGMNTGEAMQVLKKMMKKSAIDDKIVSVLEKNLKQVSSIRRVAQEKALLKYQELIIG